MKEKEKKFWEETAQITGKPVEELLKEHKENQPKAKDQKAKAKEDKK